MEKEVNMPAEDELPPGSPPPPPPPPSGEEYNPNGDDDIDNFPKPLQEVNNIAHLKKHLSEVYLKIVSQFIQFLFRNR